MRANAHSSSVRDDHVSTVANGLYWCAHITEVWAGHRPLMQSNSISAILNMRCQGPLVCYADKLALVAGRVRNSCEANAARAPQNPSGKLRSCRPLWRTYVYDGGIGSTRWALRSSRRRTRQVCRRWCQLRPLSRDKTDENNHQS